MKYNNQCYSIMKFNVIILVKIIYNKTFYIIIKIKVLKAIKYLVALCLKTGC